MGEVRTRWVAVVATVAVGALLAGCGTDGGTADSADTTTGDGSDTTVYAPGDSGMFVVEPVPDGWEIDRAYTQEDSSGVYYARGGDDDHSFSVQTYTVDPTDPQIERAHQMIENGENGITPIEVDGHPAGLGPLRDDGRTYGDQIDWFARPDLVVSVRVPWDLGVDVRALADDVHEISGPTRDALVVATTGGGEPGSPVEAMRGTVDGDEWVLNAVLPTDYPLQPIDERRGCAVLSFRGETATTCKDRFTTLNDAHQVILGGVNFGFGVVGGGGGEVELRQPENATAPPHPNDSVVLPAAPDLTWFVASFAEVCDRFGLAAGGESVIVGVPSGYRHRNDCAA